MTLFQHKLTQIKNFQAVLKFKAHSDNHRFDSNVRTSTCSRRTRDVLTFFSLSLTQIVLDDLSEESIPSLLSFPGFLFSVFSVLSLPHVLPIISSWLKQKRVHSCFSVDPRRYEEKNDVVSTACNGVEICFWSAPFQARRCCFGLSELAFGCGPPSLWGRVFRFSAPPNGIFLRTF